MFCTRDKNVEKYFASTNFVDFTKNLRLKYLSSCNCWMHAGRKEFEINSKHQKDILMLKLTKKDIPELSSSLKDFDYIGNIVYRF